MIEIGKEKTLTQGTRGAAKFFDIISGFLILAWLLRGYIGLPQYSTPILIAVFGIGLLGDVFKTNVNAGPLRSASSFFGRVTFWCISTIILILFLGWVAQLQADVLSPIFYARVPDLAIVLIFSALASIILHGASPIPKGLRATEPAIYLKQASTVDMGETKISTKADSIGLPVRKARKTVGCVVTGDLTVVFDTPMGTLNATIAGPVTSFGLPFKGERATGEQVLKLTGKRVNDLVRETQVQPSMVGETEIEVDIPPFVHINREQFQESVDVGPVSLRSGPKGEILKIGPISIDADQDSEKWFGQRYWGKHGRFAPWWSVKGSRDSSYIGSSAKVVKARWNGSSLDLRPDSMNLKVGGDGFSYSPSALETFTPLHTLRVTPDKVTLNTKKFTLDVIGTRVILRAEDGSKKSDSEQLAKDLRELLADTAKKQVGDVLEGQPIELDEMLGGTEELLKKYA